MTQALTIKTLKLERVHISIYYWKISSMGSAMNSFVTIIVTIVTIAMKDIEMSVIFQFQAHLGDSLMDS